MNTQGMIPAKENANKKISDRYQKKTYAKGATCIYGDTLYRAKADITTAEEWTAAHWEETNMETIRAEMAAEVSSLNAKTIKSIQVSFTTDSNGEAMVYNSDDIIPLFLRTNYSITNEYPKYEFFNYNGYVKVRATLFSTPVYQTLSSGISISGTFYYMEMV